MKKILVLLLLSGFLSDSLPAFSTPAGPLPAADNGLIPDVLRCEYSINPLGIESSRPRLSWTFRSNSRNQYQSAYHILVSRSLQQLEAGHGDWWDSGKVTDSSNLGIAPAGAPLRPFTRYYWKVLVWDRAGKSSGWSPAAWFETGMMSNKAWQGQWISDNTPVPAKDEDFYKDIPAPVFRKTFSIQKTIRSARLYICGLGYNEPYLNGEKIGDIVLDPAWTNYRQTIPYTIYDITSQLKTGRNTLGVLLGNGWYNPLPLKLFGRFNLRDVLPAGKPCLIANLRITYSDGSTSVIASDNTWKTGQSNILKNNVYLGETIDGRLGNPGWGLPSFDDSRWPQAITAPAPGGLLCCSAAPPIRISHSFPAKQVSSPEKNIYVVDLGQNIAGWIHMKIHGRPGQTIHFRYGELLMPDGRVNGMTTVAGQLKEIWHLNGGPGAPSTAYQQDTYICKGDDADSFQQHFTFHAFRYIEITGLDAAPAREDITGLRLNADLPIAGSFSCSNPLLNQIQQTTLNTFLSNVFSVQSDCPGREKQGYGADMVVSAEAFCYNFDMNGFYAKTIRDFADAVRPNGAMPECAPYNGIADQGFADGAGPIGWQLAFPFLQEKLYQFYGDKKIIADEYSYTKRLVGFLRSQSTDQLIFHCIGDHEAVNAKHVALTSGAMYYHHVRLLEEFARILGKKEDESVYHLLGDSIANSFNRHYLNPGTGAYDTAYNQTTQVFPLWYALTPDSLKNRSFSLLVHTIENDYHGHLATGIFGTKMLFDVLRRYGRNDLAFDMVSRPGYPGYAYMLDNGATTLWESWEKMDQDSWNHPMFGSVSEWFFRGLAGIDPAEDACGMDKLILQPSPVPGLRSAKATYQSPRGEIISSWEKNAGVLDWQVTIPPNTRAILCIPAERGQQITENGQPLTADADLTLLDRSDKLARYSAVSGAYRFTVASGAGSTVSNPDSPRVIPLYTHGIPNSKPATDEEKSEINKDGILIISKISRPTLTLFPAPPAIATGAAVIICPGGGYWVEAAGIEGYDVAKKFNEMGINAYVLKYRIPSDETMVNREIGALQDAQQAIKLVRENAAAWHINPSRIGIMGFSAGGHLASTAGTHFNHAYIPNSEGTSLRPNFMILGYPVITCIDSFSHGGSCQQIIGPSPSPEKAIEYSNQLQVTDSTPPTFIVHATDDTGVPPQNSISFYQALLKHHVPAELHLYQNSGHGFGLHLKGTKEEWILSCRNWMEANGWLTPAAQ